MDVSLGGKVDMSLDIYGVTLTKGLLYCLALSLLLHLLAIILVGSNSKPGRNYSSLDVELRHPEPATPNANRVTVARTPETRFPTAKGVVEPPEKNARPRSAPQALVGLPEALPLYLPDNMVEVWAEPANDVALQYPYIAYLQRLRGRVRVELFINEIGYLDRLQIIDASPKGVFEQAAIDAVSQLQFYPAQMNGVAVKSRKTIEVAFDPDDMDVTSEPAAQAPSAAGK